MLNFGRIESAQARYRAEAAAVEDVVGAALAAVDTRRAQGGFTITVSAPDFPLPQVRLDESAMIQVFVNLLDNAMKYSGSCRRVRVELYRRGAEVLVAVVDGGIGIARDELDRIFEEFYRAAASSAGVAGTGLGLAIAQHVVQAQGGRIEVESSLGNGATFTVVLPVADLVSQHIATPPALDRSEIEVRA